MANKVNPTPNLAKPTNSKTLEGLSLFDQDFLRTVYSELLDHAQRLNNALVKDGTEPMDAPLVLPTYTVAGVPSAATYARGLIYVSNETGGATVAFSDGTNWRRAQDRAIVS